MKNKALTTLLIIGSFFAIVVVGIFILSKTSVFHSYLRSNIISKAESSLNAKLKLGDISGDLFTGININNAAIVQNNDTVISIQNVEIGYDLLKLVNGENEILSVSIYSPKISVIRFKNQTFNLQNIYKPSEGNNSLSIKNLAIINGSINFTDEVNNKKRIINNIKSEIGVNVTPEKTNLSISTISLIDESTKLKLAKGKLNITLTPYDIVLSEVELKSIESNIKGSIKLVELEKSPKAIIALDNSQLSFNEISKISGVNIPLNGEVKIKGEFEGSLAEINFSNIELKHKNSQLNFAGNAIKLGQKNEEISVTIKSSIINPPDFISLIPSYKEYLREMTEVLVSGELIKTETQTKANFNINKENQEIKLIATLSTRKNDESVSISVEGEDVDISDFVGKKYSESKLNFTANLTRSLNSFNYKVELTPSTYNLVKINSANLLGTYENNIFQGDYFQISDVGELGFKYLFNNNKKDINATTFEVLGNFKEVNLANILKDSIHNSLLSGTFNLSTQGIDIDNALVKGEIKFQDSRYNKFNFDTSTVFLSFGKKNKLWEYTFNSRLADATFKGDFSPRLLQHSFRTTLAQITKLVRSKKENILNSLGIAQKENQLKTESVSQLPFKISYPQNCEYKISINNLEPITMLLELPSSNATVEIEGILKTKGSKLSLSGKSLILTARSTIEEKKFYIDNFDLNYSISNIDLLKESNISEIDLFLESTFDALYYGNTKYENVSIEFELKNQKSRFLISSTIDSVISTEVQGGVLFSENDISATLRSVYFRYGTIHLNNNKPVTFNFTKNGINIPKLTLFESSTESVINTSKYISLSGELTKLGMVNSQIEVNKIDISALMESIGDKKLFANVISSASLQINGTLSKPQITSKVDITWNSEKNKSENQLIGELRYNENLAQVNLDLLSPIESNKIFSINGNVPVNLSLFSSPKITGDGLDLKIAFNNFNFNYIEPYFSTLENINGKINGTLTATGSVEKPELNGNLSFNNIDFLYSPNRLHYIANGSLLFEESNLKFSKFTLRNSKSEYSKSNVDISGTINLKDFNNLNYNIIAKGELLVMQHGYPSLSNTFYGELILATTSDGLHFDGSSGTSKMHGKLLLRNANLIIPPSQIATVFNQSKISNIIVVDDTSRVSRDNYAFQEMMTFLQERNLRLQKPSPLDKFIYDLQFQTDGIVTTRFIFNPATNEELLAYLEGSFSIRNTNKTNEMFGTINVTERSTYTFYKQFNASGNIEFLAEPSNPKLNIIAVYTGTRLKLEQNANPPTEDVHVQLEITGTRIQPIPKLSLYQVNEKKERTERTSDIEGDVISFLLTSSPGIPGKFREDLNLNDKQGISEVLGTSVSVSMINSFTNTLLSGMMMDFVRANNITFISNAELRYSTDTPDLRLGGEVLDAYWSFGGKVFSDLNNANLSLQMPLSSITGSRKYKNFIFEIERKIDPFEYNVDKQSVVGARVYYKIIF